MQEVSRGAIVDAIVGFRWVMLLGQAMAIATGALALAEQDNFAILLTVLLVGHLPTYLLALYPRWFVPNNWRLELLFIYDLIHNGLIIWLAGGIFNPFLLLMIVPVTSAAIVCRLGSTFRLMGFAVFLIIIIGIDSYHRLANNFQSDVLLTYISMTGMAFILAICFASIIAFRLTREGKRLETAAGLLRSMLERERGVSALGAHAAATAHELGSPLSTIAIIASELAKDKRLPDDVVNDLTELRDQTRRCREILSDLARRGEVPDQQECEWLPLNVTIDRALHRITDSDKKWLRVQYMENGRQVDPRIDHAPFLPDLPGITLAFKSLIENALRFGRNRVDIVCSWCDDEVSIAIRDDGPGFARDVIERLGEPFVKDQWSNGLGLGVFTAQALLTRSGAKISFHNRSDPGGAEVFIMWDRGAMTQLMA